VASISVVAVARSSGSTRDEQVAVLVGGQQGCDGVLAPDPVG
jgi:hypothetical protein